jgi:galactoside O-acetyltransferase
MNPFNPGYYDQGDLRRAGFRSVGNNVQIAKNCTIIGLENISIGSNVRIDGYCSIIAANEGWVTFGSFIHVGAYCLLSAGHGIEMANFSGLSQGVRLYSQSDDYSGDHLTNPTVPEKYTGVIRGTITLHRHVIVGANSVILPNVTIGEGSSVGALSLVTHSLAPWGVFTGRPARKLKDRSRHLIALEQAMQKELAEKNTP